jgi:hypothetical protein
MPKEKLTDVTDKKFKRLRKKILGTSLTVGHLDATAKHSRRKIYDTVDFLWIHIVLNALGCVTIRSEMAHLTWLLKKNRLTSFYKLIGVTNFPKKIPSLGFFSDFVNYFDLIEFQKIMNLALAKTPIINDILKQTEYKMFSVDGKHIRRCIGGVNVQSVNVVVNHVLQRSFMVDSEATWVKDHLTNLIEEIFKEDKEHYVFIGDGLYHNERIRKFIKDNGYLAILPMMHLTKQFEGRLNFNVDIKKNQNKHKFVNTTEKSKGWITDETVTITPAPISRYRDFEKWTYIVDLHAVSTHIKTGEVKINDRRFLTNLDLPCTDETATKLRALIRQHWQVETFHQYKDINFKEDRYPKAKHKAAYRAIINNLSKLLQTMHGVKGVHDIANFKVETVLAIAFLFLFFAYVKPLNYAIFVCFNKKSIIFLKFSNLEHELIRITRRHIFN